MPFGRTDLSYPFAFPIWTLENPPSPSALDVLVQFPRRVLAIAHHLARTVLLPRRLQQTMSINPRPLYPRPTTPHAYNLHPAPFQLCALRPNNQFMDSWILHLTLSLHPTETRWPSMALSHIRLRPKNAEDICTGTVFFSKSKHLIPRFGPTCIHRIRNARHHPSPRKGTLHNTLVTLPARL